MKLPKLWKKAEGLDERSQRGLQRMALMPREEEELILQDTEVLYGAIVAAKPRSRREALKLIADIQPILKHEDMRNGNPYHAYEGLKELGVVP